MEVLGSADKRAWITAVQGITTGVWCPIFAQLSDFWGRKWPLVFGLVLAMVGSIIMARADSFGVLLFGDVLTSALVGVLPLLHSILSEILPRSIRPWAQASIHVGGSLGAVTCLYVGGALCKTSPEGFRTFFEIAAGLFFLCGAAITISYRPPPRELQKLNAKERLAKLDYIGFFLLSTSVVLCCVGLSWSQNPYQWSNAHILGTFIAGVVVLIALVIYVAFINKTGFIHHDLFRKNRNFGLVLVCIFCEGAIFFCPLNYFGFQLAVIYQLDLFRIALVFSTAWWAYGVFAVLTGWYGTRTQQFRIPIMVAFLCGVIYFVLMATTGSQGVTALYGYGIFLGAFLGICLNILVVTAQMSTPRELIASATSLVIMFRGIATGFGLTMYTAIFSRPLAVLAGPTRPIIQVEVAAYEAAFRDVYICAGAFCFVALCGKHKASSLSQAVALTSVVSFFIKDDRSEFTAEIDAPIYEESVFEKGVGS